MMAFIWASKLGSLKPLALFCICLVWIHRDQINRILEPIDIIKGIPIPALQIRINKPKVPFLVVVLAEEFVMDEGAVMFSCTL